MTAISVGDTGTAAARDLLACVLRPDPPPFALIRRRGAPGTAVDLLVGEVTEVNALARLPLPGPGGGPGVLAVIPYRQVRERGFACHDDGEPILVLAADRRAVIPVADLLSLLPGSTPDVRDGAFETGDEDYARIVERIIADEIRTGEGSNFVIGRTFQATLPGYEPWMATAVFRRLLMAEVNAYWTFVVHTGDRTFVGASPEQHVRMSRGTVSMNPISGTYRYPPDGPDLQGILGFLDDQKETDELYMVVDEELKMLAAVCDGGARVHGPYLREMARLAHTEYVLRGRTSMDVRELLRETMFAPTVVGSPLENACRVIARHEPGGRGYYGGALAAFGTDGAGRPSLDSAILIRTAEIGRAGQLRAGVGATLVRHSQPAAEVAETWAKAEALLEAIGVRTRRASAPRAPAPAGPIAARWEVTAALQRRNTGLSSFWLASGGSGLPAGGLPPIGPVLVVEAEDMFTGMLGHQLRSLGADITVRPCASVLPAQAAEFGCVVLGPGPGDPRSRSDSRVIRLRELAEFLLATRTPFIAECLSHQVLADVLGLPLIRRAVPNQGTQHEVDLFGRPELVGFYNSYAARHASDRLVTGRAGGEIEVCRDELTGEVHALRGPGFASTQFHLESVLTKRGVRILAGLLSWAVRCPGPPHQAVAVTEREAG